MAKAKEIRLQDYFRDLDHHFIGLQKAKDECFTYNSTDVLVQTTWELPIVVQWPDSVVNYEFSSQQGDIWFGILFVAAASAEDDLRENLDVEPVEELARVPSGTETIKGSFELQCEGVLFFLWDNTFDWSATKKVSYKIEVHEPSFTLPDKIRTSDCLPELRQTFESLDNNLNRLADAQDFLENNIANMKFLEDQILKVSQKLQTKKGDAKKAHFLLTDLEISVDRYEQYELPLLFRNLNRNLTKQILDYVQNESSVYLVCTYWNQLLQMDLQEMKINQSSRPKHPKMTKEEKEKLLFLIKHKVSMSKSHDDREEEESNYQRKYLSKTHSIVTSEEERTLKNTTGSQPPTDHPQTNLLLSNKEELSEDDSSNTFSSLDKDTSPNPGAQARHMKGNSPQKKDQIIHIRTKSSPRVKKEGVEINLPELDDKEGEGEDDDIGKGKNVTVDVPLDFKPKVIHERRPSNGGVGKQRASAKSPASGIVGVGGSAGGGKKDRLPKVDSKLLENVQKIRSEQQLLSIMEYLQVGFAKIDKLSFEKRKVKKLIKAWNATYQKQFGKLPSSSERKGHLRELYEDYHKISLALKIKRQKLNDLMNKVGITEETYQEMRNSL